MVKLDAAVKLNTNQPLIQRGIILYCLGRYDEALQQLMKDTEIMEKAKFMKASDLRIWTAACCNKLGLFDNALVAIDSPKRSPNAMPEERYILNSTLSFFAKENTLDDMLELVGSADPQDVAGTTFYGNFYLGLYFDSVGEVEMARSFMQFPYESDRYKTDDMWHHLPRMLYKQRGWDVEPTVE